MAEQGESSKITKIAPKDIRKMAYGIADFFDKDKNEEIDEKKYEERFRNWNNHLKTLDEMEDTKYITREQKNYIIANLICKKEFDSEHDFLTGFYNRGGFKRRSKELLNRSLHQKTPLTLVEIDVDNFKILNDQKGHEAGDRFLILFSNIFKFNIRKEDLMARFGGDEFMILLEQNKEKSQVILKRAQKQIKRLIDLDFPNLRKPLSFSYGFFELNEVQKKDFNAFLNFADQKMYEMKTEKKQKNG